ncbi:MAG: hypothetical protein ACFFDF_01250 [Candidatus Odinarchaeota archaeon]
MRVQNIRNFAVSGGIIIILTLILYSLIGNYIILSPFYHSIDYTLRTMIETENFFWYLSLGSIGIGLYCILSQLKMYSFKRNIATLISLFFLVIITFFDLLRINFIIYNIADYTEYYYNFVSDLAIILILSSLSFIGVILGILAHNGTD